MRGRVFRRCPKPAEGQEACGKRCNHRWAFVVDVGSVKRRQVMKSGFATKREAEAALGEVIQRAKKGDKFEEMTAEKWLRDWLTAQVSAGKLRPSTARSYGQHIDLHLAPAIGHIRLSVLRVEHLDVMYEKLRQPTAERPRPLSPASLRRINATLSSALQTAFKRGHVVMNVARLVDLESGKRPSVTVWSAEDLGRFLDGIAEDRYAELYELDAYTGLRRGELCGLRWEDVDLQGGAWPQQAGLGPALRVEQQRVQVGQEVVVGPPKSRAGARYVPLNQEAVEALRRQRVRQAADRLAMGPAWTETGLVFTREDGVGLMPEFVTKHFLALCDEHGLPRIKLHALRHTHATISLAAGVDLLTISRRLGHSALGITADTYTKITPQVAIDAADKMASMVPRVSMLPHREQSVSNEPDGALTGEAR